MASLSTAALALGIGLPSMLFAIWLGHRVDLVDRPGPIKPHARAIPHTGGAAIALVVLASGALAGAPPAVLASIALMCAIGFIDDLRGLSAPIKLALETVPLAISVSALELPLVLMVSAVAIGVVLVNAFNVVDGLDGLASGVALPAFIILSAAPSWPGLLAAATAGALVAFLLVNLHPARLFMGDEGSLVIGQLLWLLPLVALQHRGFTSLPVWTGLWLFPIINALFVVAIRLRQRRSVLRGDRSHLYDVLHRRLGLTKTLLICWLVAAAGAIGALATG